MVYSAPFVQKDEIYAPPAIDIYRAGRDIFTVIEGIRERNKATEIVVEVDLQSWWEPSLLLFCSTFLEDSILHRQHSFPR
jgi:hypothetical protein